MTALAISPVARAADETAADEIELTAAIAAINAAGEGDHSITLTADITLTAPLPPISNTEATNILLEGDTHILDADGVGTALIIESATTVTIQNLTITGGAGSSYPDSQSGGGIANRGHLTIIDTTLIGNSATNGGGIVNYGNNLASPTLILDGVTIVENEATEFGGGIYNNAGGATAIVTATNSNIIDNEAFNTGGGIANHGLNGTARVEIFDTTLSGNTAVNLGGGIFNNGNDGEAYATLDRATLWNNSATSGGGIFNNGNLGTASVSLLNSTVSENTATLQGGGILNNPNNGLVMAYLTYTTVAGNQAAWGGGLVNRPGGTVEVGASIISAGEQGAACGITEEAVITSTGYNIDSDDSCGLSDVGDIPGGNPALEPLALNEPGTTQTHAIGDDSDAHSKVPAGIHGCGGFIAIDQRGATRPSPEPLCDIGAFESTYPDEEPPPTCEAPYVPTNEEELNTAIECVNDAGPGSHTITLANNINLSGSANSFDNAEADEIILDGDNFILNGNLSGTVLAIEPGTEVVLKNITVTGGQGTNGPTSNWGGGIYNRGELTIQDSTLTGNTAWRGGGVTNHGDGTAATLNIVRSTLSGNTAVKAGGAVLNISNDEGSASLNVVNSTFSGNSAETGGGLFNEADIGNSGANLVYTTLADNTATIGGGGIHTVSNEGNSSVTMAATIISNGPGGSDDCASPSGSIISTGYNLASDTTCNLTQDNDLPAADAGLLPLALNAPGQTATHALGATSQAKNTIHPGGAGCGTAITTDQRGSARPESVDGMCDIGAFEAPAEIIEEPEPIIYLPMVRG